MNRRDWLKGGAALAAAAGVVGKAEAQASNAGAGREYYLIRKYTMQSGPTFSAVANKYFSGALLPALGRMGIGPVGVFNLSYGPETPTMYVLLPGTDLKALAMLDLNLANDPAFMKDATEFWGPPATLPPFDRCESSLSVAFEGYPKLTVPPKEPRIFQLRTYESPTYAAHVRKVDMFHKGEFRIFAESGSKGIFYSDNLIGPRLPSLTYMLCHKDLTAMDANWKGFNSHPDWQKLSHDPRYASEPTVSRVDNLLMNPTPYSQI
jgi:hypothetical protein